MQMYICVSNNTQTCTRVHTNTHQYIGTVHVQDHNSNIKEHTPYTHVYIFKKKHNITPRLHVHVHVYMYTCKSVEIVHVH